MHIASQSSESTLKSYKLLFWPLIAMALLPTHSPAQFKKKATQLFHAVYIEDDPNIDKMLADDVVISYPVFERIFNKKVLRGKEAYLNFSSGFKSRWIDRKMEINETLVEDNKVLLVWSFSAIMITNDSTSAQPQEWGGMTLYQFNNNGKLQAEIGEESAPGPYKRGEFD